MRQTASCFLHGDFDATLVHCPQCKPKRVAASADVYCPHGYVLPGADHPAAGLERCEHGCTDSLFVSDEELVGAEEEAREVFGF